jgi:hypothetical protein
MIQIENKNLLGQVVAESLKAIDADRSTNTGEKLRLFMAVAKATAKLEQDGCFMDYDADAERLLIWSQDSNQTYFVSAGACECKAYQHGVICWHRIAKRLIENYWASENAPAQVFSNPATIPYLKPADSRQPEAIGSVRI